MAKAQLKFDLPEEKCEFKIASDAMNWALCLSDIDQKLRNYLNYGNNFISVDDCLEKIRLEVIDLMLDRNISFNDIE